MNQRDLRRVSRQNLAWFRRSGVMRPEDGSWGVAERLVVTEGNEALDKIYTSFPAWTEHRGYSVIEQRRADCNFEVAWLFLLAYEVFGNRRDYDTAVNLLDFLYFRSGLLNRHQASFPAGAWKWSHIQWTPTFWFDDNGWNGAIPLWIARKYPELDRRYALTRWGLTLADSLSNGLTRTLDHPDPAYPGQWIDPRASWAGNVRLPHWGSLACLALTAAHAVQPKADYAAVVERYHHTVSESLPALNASEQAYALMVATRAAKTFDRPGDHALASALGNALIARMDPDTGNIPAEHVEAPVGPHLVDTIYTVNWALLGLQSLAALTGRAEHRKAFEKLLALVADIQDRAEEPAFKGCWRGLYDLREKRWGGGNRFEGGAGSIYTGWTNAPIGWVFLLHLLDRTLAD